MYGYRFQGVVGAILQIQFLLFESKINNKKWPMQ
jgi:hypothetical protein